MTLRLTADTLSVLDGLTAQRHIPRTTLVRLAILYLGRHPDAVLSGKKR